MKSLGLLPALALASLLAPAASGQSLLGLDNGHLAATGSLVSEFSPGCVQHGHCPTLGIFGPSIPSPFGGIAYNWLDRTVWITDGLLLVQMDESCNVLQRCSTNASNTTRWTGLAIDPLNDVLYYTTPTNDIYSVQAACPLMRSRLICSIGPAILNLTGIEYDHSDGSLWVCDDMGRVSKITGPSPTGGCMVRHSFTARCPNANPVLPFQGITLDPLGGKVFLTDSGNGVITCDLAGNPLHCCTIASPGAGVYQVGLARKPERVHYRGNGCSGRPCPNCSPILRETSDPHIPNPHFALKVSEGPVGGAAFYLFSGGGGILAIPGLCGPFRVDLIPPPVIVGPLGLMSTGGIPCTGEATLVVPIPLDPALYGATVYSQVFGLCILSIGTGHFMSDGVEITLT